jgi:hypothetical protein
MNGNNNFNTHLPILEGGFMKTFFGAHDLMEIVHRELKKNDYKALFYIRQGVDGSNFEKISKITKAKEA